MTGIVSVAVLLIGTVLLYTCSDTRGLENAPAVEQPAVMQVNPLAELVDRIHALDADVAELQDRVAELEDRQPVAAPLPGARRASGISQNHPPSPAPRSKRWGTTDLDREIEEFSQSISLESAK
ncbi:MAG: hypothetical protein A3E51_05345 [Burkholderiales bacterium RIFCSPHIGHO2_12_FULL_67_38]|nr:MAG: hypothetical protein A3I64_07060 [Burkholderiales bacterium RIFCSPLOWO2_02_FULL_67_64]OGB39997.1 MAG: hypothetical protein A3E51_05345 [Burkholderiales bacterium RIFCSPHIGHO2_12_FULL_67_38]OGB87182.1 MAG: hypothetical protein A3G82_19430 [Burkholderiales bacterium RIFCSPLOWO2_12_FULL_67_210]